MEMVYDGIDFLPNQNKTYIYNIKRGACSTFFYLFNIFYGYTMELA
jgi:alanine-alpha-ketoisovalerate/valine-pyruvate aminotransferase